MREEERRGEERRGEERRGEERRGEERRGEERRGEEGRGEERRGEETRRDERSGDERRGEERRGEAAAHLATAHADSQPRARIATDLSSGHDSPISPRISPTYTAPLLAAQSEGAAHGSGAERVKSAAHAPSTLGTASDKSAPRALSESERL